MTRATASSFHGTPGVSDVRRARAARFSISPAQNFGSPSFSLGLERFPQPPVYDDCGEKEPLKSVEKESRKQRKLSIDEGSHFSLGLEEIQAPPTSEYCTQEGTPKTSREAFKQRQLQETREVQPFNQHREDYTLAFKYYGCLGTDPPKTAEEPGNNQGRAFKVFSGPSFSLGLEGSSSPTKSDDGLSREEKSDDGLSREETQAYDCTRAHADRIGYSFSGHLKEGHRSSSKSRLLQKSGVDQGTVVRSTFLQVSPDDKSAGPKCDERLKSSVKVTSKPKSLRGGFPPASSPLFERQSELSTSSSVQSFGEQVLKQTRLFEGLSPADRVTGPVENEPTSDSDVTWTANHPGTGGNGLGSENTPPATEKIRPTPRSVSSSSSHEAQTSERRLDEDGSSRSQEFRAVDCTNDFQTVSLHHRVGPTSKKEEFQGVEGKFGKCLPYAFSHCPTVIVLSQESEDKSALGQLQRRHGEDSQELKILVECVGVSEVSNQRSEKEKVDALDVSTPPPPPRRVSKRPHRDSYGFSESEIVQDSEDEQHTDFIPKRRRLSKPYTQNKAELSSTSCLEDLTCPLVDIASAAVDRTSGTLVAERNTTFKRLRRGSTSASKTPDVSHAPQNCIDRCVAVKKVKLDSSDPSPILKKQSETSVNDTKEQRTYSPECTNQEEFDDIEEFSEHELPCTGSRPHGDRRNLQSQIQRKKLQSSTSSPVVGKKPVLHIPGLDTLFVLENRGKAEAESNKCLETKILPSNIAKKRGNVKAEPITLSDDEDLWLERSKLVCSENLPPKALKDSKRIFQKQKPVSDDERAGARSGVLQRGSSSKGKGLWKAYAEDFPQDDEDVGPGERLADARDIVSKLCQSEGVKIADLLRERLPHFKPVEALMSDGGLDQEPVYIDYRNQFGRSQRMDGTAFAEADCSQPQRRRKGKRSSSKSTKDRSAYASTSATNSSQRTSAIKSPGKGKRKAWTLFRETKGRASASGSTPGKGYWIVENGKRVYVKDGRTLTGRSAYAAYKKDSGKMSRKTKKSGTKAKR